jgi:hypothetical protein
VRFDNESAIAALTERAIAEGHSRIALVASMFFYGNAGQTPPCFSEALEAHGLRAENDFVALSIDAKSSAFSATLQMLKTGVPDAIVTCAAHFAEGIVEALHCNGYRVPEDVGLYTFDEENWSLMEKEDGVVRLYRRPITLGNAAAMLLLENILSPLTFEPRTVSLPTVPPSEPVAAQPLHTSIRDVTPETAIRAVLLTPSYSKEVESLLPNFTNKTGISVDLSLRQHAAYIDYVNSRLIKSDPPDVFLVDIPWIRSYVEEGLIEDLTPYLPPIEELRSLYLPNCFDNLGEIGAPAMGCRSSTCRRSSIIGRTCLPISR